MTGARALTAFHQSWPQGADGASVLLPFNLFSPTAQLCSGNNAIPVHGWDPQHGSWNNGNDNDRFVVIHAEEQNDGPEQAPLVMGYFTRQQLGYYYALADAFTICDNYFCSVLGPTMPNRLYFMSAFLDPKGTHGGPVLETPGTLTESTEAIGSVQWDTMPEVLSDHGISWKVYQPPGTSVGTGINLALYDGFNVLLYFKQYVSRPRTDLYRRAFLPTWPNEFLGRRSLWSIAARLVDPAAARVLGAPQQLARRWPMDDQPGARCPHPESRGVVKDGTVR